jgi:CRP/FNR family transcriptional regulator, anaerobic regulatory protein
MDERNDRCVSAGLEPAPSLCEACTARHRGICGALSDGQLRELASRSVKRKIESGRILQADGEQVSGYANLLQGVVKLSKIMADGRQQIVGLQFPPDFVGRPFGRESRLSAEAVSAVELCTFPRAVLENMLERHPELERRLFEQTLLELDDARDWLLALGRKTARERVASLIHMVAKHTPPESLHEGKAPGSLRFDLPLTRADMADFLGLTIETVSRQITRLRQDGIVDLHPCRQMEVPDMQRLAKAAQG